MILKKVDLQLCQRKKNSFYKQPNSFDCAPACLKMLLDFYDIENTYSIENLRNICSLKKEGTTIENLNSALFNIGFDSEIMFSTIEDLHKIKLPSILFIYGKHYAILNKIYQNKVYIMNLLVGKEVYSLKEFKKIWALENEEGILLTVKKNKSLLTKLKMIKQRQI